MCCAMMFGNCGYSMDYDNNNGQNYLNNINNDEQLSHNDKMIGCILSNELRMLLQIQSDSDNVTFSLRDYNFFS